MSTRLKASLEKVIQDWMDAHCEDDDWPDMYIYDGTVEDMSNAAYSVIDISWKSAMITMEENS